MRGCAAQHDYPAASVMRKQAAQGPPRTALRAECACPPAPAPALHALRGRAAAALGSRAEPGAARIAPGGAAAAAARGAAAAHHAAAAADHAGAAAGVARAGARGARARALLSSHCFSERAAGSERRRGIFRALVGTRDAASAFAHLRRAGSPAVRTKGRGTLGREGTYVLAFSVC